MSDGFIIKSHKGPYPVRFEDGNSVRFENIEGSRVHYLIDRRVAKLHADNLAHALQAPSVLLIDATESNKSLDKLGPYVQHLIERKTRRQDLLVAVGGGIIQDITCFLAATLLRGVRWYFFPTTLLAQADSCIGSKSSINCLGTKNILGTFTPPCGVTVNASFLQTLEEHDVRSGVGEMLKAHAIRGPDTFNEIRRDYERLFEEQTVMLDYIKRSLEIKKKFIEDDEFDSGPRRLFNYGHTFGHAIEAATDFSVPHGIAVTIGMDMANYCAGELGYATTEHFFRMHDVLAKNFRGFEKVEIKDEKFLNAILNDKKNVGTDSVTAILPNMEGRVEVRRIEASARFSAMCSEYLKEVRLS